MDTVLNRPWTTESFLAWEDRKAGKHEFDGRDVISLAGGSIAHQRIVGNLWATLMRLLNSRRSTQGEKRTGVLPTDR